MSSEIYILEVVQGTVLIPYEDHFGLEDPLSHMKQFVCHNGLGPGVALSLLKLMGLFGNPR
jgi:hypothetical protein